MRLRGGKHCAFSSGSSTCSFGESVSSCSDGSGDVTLTATQQQTATLDALLPWLESHLRN